MSRFYSLFCTVVLVLVSSISAQVKQIAPHAAVSNCAEFLEIDSESYTNTTMPKARQVQYSSASFLPMIRPLNSLTLNNFPVSLTESRTVVLRRVRTAADANTILLASGVNGDTPFKLPEVIIFKGAISGEPNSKVTLCTVKDEIICSIHREDGSSYTLAHSSEQNSSTHYLVSDKVIHQKNDMLHCMSEEAYLDMKKNLTVPQSALDTKSTKILSDNLLEVRVAVECDNKFYKDFNDSSKAAAYAIALISLASITYEDEIHTVLTIPWLKIWTTPDPYNVNGDGYALVWKAQAYWKQNLQDVDRDLVHTFTSGGGGGIALQYPLSNGGGGTTICNHNDGFGSSSPFTHHTYPTFDFTYGVYITAHEIGHNFGAVHSHSCYWNPPFDTCIVSEGISGKCFPDTLKERPNPGSIMSYCPSINLAQNPSDFSYYRVNMTFLPPIATYMREQVESLPCITSATKPVVVLSYPRGSEPIETSTITIRWQSAHVQNIMLEYSPDAGVTWVQIAASIPAVDGEFRWNLPIINTTQMIIRISDVLDETVSAGSILPFKAVNTTGVSEERVTNALELHPSITDGELILEGDLTVNTQHLSVVLYSLHGKEVHKWNIPVSAGHFVHKFDVSDVPPGVYSIQVRSTGVQYSKTLIRR